MVTRAKRVVFRCEEPLFDFIKEFAYSNGLTTSELIRNVLVYFHMGYLMGEFKKSFPEMKREFMSKSGRKNVEKPGAKKKHSYDI